MVRKRRQDWARLSKFEGEGGCCRVGIRCRERILWKVFFSCLSGPLLHDIAAVFISTRLFCADTKWMVCSLTAMGALLVAHTQTHMKISRSCWKELEPTVDSEWWPFEQRRYRRKLCACIIKSIRQDCSTFRPIVSTRIHNLVSFVVIVRL